MLYIKGSYSLHTINVQCLLSPICIALRYFNMLCAGERAVAERHMEEACAASIRRFRKVRRVNHSSLSELFISFLAKVIISVMLSTLMKNLGCRHLYGVYQISRYILPEYATKTIYLDYKFFFLNVYYVPDVYILGKCPFLIIVC